MAHLLSIAAWLCLLLPASGSPSSILGTRAANETLTVDLGYGVYQGYHNSTVNQNVWQGIRYAAPPTGENRFRAPKAPSISRNATIAATSLPQRCPQGPQAPLPARYNYTGSEDCLFLSVYAPTDARDLPVFVWIHGGGYGGGQGNQDVGNISMINHNSFVSVVIQYRLGAFGFLSSDEVERFGDVNNGIRDQFFALQWVQSHIRQFGGDPRRVTIAGESAGAGSVMLLSMAYGGTLGTSLFQNVIAASPYLPMQYGYADWQPSQGYYSFAAAVGCFPGRAYGNSSSTIIDCLRLAPSKILQNASAVVGASGTWGTWAFLPVTDKDFIRSRPTSQLTAGKVNGARVLSGNNALEGAAFVNPYNISTDADFEAWVKLSYPLLSSSDLDKVFSTYYPASNDSSTTPYATSGTHGETFVNVDSVATGAFARAIALYSETTFVCPSYWLADAFQAHGKEAYKYQFSVPAAQHGADLSAEGLRAQASNIGDAFYKAFTTIWGNFITRSSPSISSTLANGNGSLAVNAASDWPVWTSHGKNAYQMLNLNQTGGTEVSAHVIAYPVQNATQSIGPGLMNDFQVVDAYSWEGGRGKRCEFWRSVSDRVPE